ncbi:MAG: small basic protein [Candidatus Omnitrophica bacterium]|nr:small basic protein [Candidatus Omnitrophota bacterium]
MSLHSSLKIDTAGAQQRSVLTRIERMKEMMKKGLWKEARSAVGLPKTKIVKIKARKTVKEAKPEEGAAGAAAPGGAAGAKGAPAAKAAAPAAGAKAPAKK